ncbi:MCE family protein [Mycolicibacterium vanbaalenii]|nr:MCE family protein [Mycolicibacterium vanbaalenii]
MTKETNGPARRSATAKQPNPATSARKHRSLSPGLFRPLAGATFVLVIAGIVVLAAALFNGSLTKTVPVTVISDRAGLVMNPDAKVKLRDIQVGTVRSIEARPDGMAAIHLSMDPSQLQFIPANTEVDIASPTLFGSKAVQLRIPSDPSVERLHAGQVVQGKHVMVEANTVFERLTDVLDGIDPAKLNQILGAVASALNGNGEKVGQSLSELNELLGVLEPSLPNLSHDIDASVPMLTAYADAAPDLMNAIDNTSQISRTITDQQQHLDKFLVSAIGLADEGNAVIGGNRDALAGLLQLLIPTTEVLSKYHEGLGCSLKGLIPFANMTPSPVPGAMIAAGLTLGTERYRYPQDLPKVAAKGRSYCAELGLPEIKPGDRPPIIIGDVGSNPTKYGNQGILLNSDALKQWLFGPIPGPPRNTSQIGMPG